MIQSRVFLVSYGGLNGCKADLRACVRHVVTIEKDEDLRTRVSLNLNE